MPPKSGNRIENGATPPTGTLARTRSRSYLVGLRQQIARIGVRSLATPASSVILQTALLVAFTGEWRDIGSLAGTLLLVLAIHLFLLVYLVCYHRETVIRAEHSIFVHLAMALVTALGGLISLQEGLSHFLVPYAFGPIVLTILFRPGLAMAVSVAIAALVGHLHGFEGGPMVLALASQILGIFAVRRTRKRIHVVWAGFGLAAIGVILAVALHLVDATAAKPGPGYDALFGALAGILAAFGGVLMLPLFEDLLDITTVFKIQELSDLDHPLLRNLFLRAPGTYQHSMMVSNLAVTAAEAIGADFLLCRVGAYFHDIGKAENPEYFAENEPYGGRSRHEDLKPSLSASVIRSHVTQGLKIAKEHGLPGAVRDFIPQHHGTSVIRYFYGKALDSRQVGPEYEGEFRYSGPKPQSRETAIVMLSDSVDAVSRTLEKPSPSSIEDAVRDTIRNRLLDGDLDESDLTLADLNTVAETFIKVLNGTFHHRPEYPARDAPETEETRDGGGNRKKSKRSNPPVHPGKGG